VFQSSIEEIIVHPEGEDWYNIHRSDGWMSLYGLYKKSSSL